MIAVCFLLSVLCLPVNLFYWLAEDNLLSGVAALVNFLTIAVCFWIEAKGERK